MEEGSMASRAVKAGNPVEEAEKAVRRGARKIVKRAVKRAIKNEFKLLALNTAHQVDEVKKAVKKAVTGASKSVKKSQRTRSSAAPVKPGTRRSHRAQAQRAASLSLKGP
jgi:hypothetical protein